MCSLCTVQTRTFVFCATVGNAANKIKQTSKYVEVNKANYSNLYISLVLAIKVNHGLTGSSCIKEDSFVVLPFTLFFLDCANFKITVIIRHILQFSGGIGNSNSLNTP